MKNLILRILTVARNLFRRLGVQPPYWLIQLGRRIHDKYSRVEQPSPPAFAGRDTHNLSQLEAKIDRVLWTIERMEATLYIQSLQAPIQPAPLNAKPNDASPKA